MKFLFAFLISIFSFTSLLQAQFAWEQEVNKIAQQYVNKKKNKGLVIGIIDGEKVWTKGFGTNSQKDQTPDQNTIFEIGNLSQTFTSYLAIQQELEAQYALTDPISIYLPGNVTVGSFQPVICKEVKVNHITDQGKNIPVHIISCQINEKANTRSVSLCDLLVHTSGIPNLEVQDYQWDPFDDEKVKKRFSKAYSREMLYQDLTDLKLSSNPGDEFMYSNFGTAILGQIIADINNQDYQTVLQSRVLDPIGMQNTSTHPNAQQVKLMSMGHNYKGKSIRPNKFGAFDPALGLKSNAADLIKFLQVNLSTQDENLIDVLNEMLYIKVKNIGYKWKQPVSTTNGWFVTPIGEQDFYWQEGATSGFSSFMGFIPGTKKGVVILSNSAQRVDQISYEIVQSILGAKTPSTLSSTRNMSLKK